MLMEFSFEELQPFKGLHVLVNGSAEIVGEWEPADPDSGIMTGGWGYYVESIFIDPIEAGQAKTEIGEEHPLYSPILMALQSSTYSDNIREKLSEGFEPDADYLRDSRGRWGM